MGDTILNHGLMGLVKRSLTKGRGEGLTAAMPVPVPGLLQSNSSVQRKQLLSRVGGLCGCRAQTGRILGNHWVQSKRKKEKRELETHLLFWMRKR